MSRYLALLTAVAAVAAIGVSPAGGTVSSASEGTPQAQLQTVLATLTPLAFRPGRQKPGTIKLVYDAVTHLQRSLEPSLWSDGSHLSGEQGHQVFEELRGSVAKLNQIDDPDPVVTSSAAVITNAAVGLAQISDADLRSTLAKITEPALIDEVQTTLSRADAEIAQALADAEAGQQAEAIQQSSGGWHDTTLGLKACVTVFGRRICVTFP